jgi:hypothetical protein
MMLEGVWKTETKKEEEMQNCVHAEYIHSPGSLGLNLFLGGGHTKHQRNQDLQCCLGNQQK